MSIQQCDDASAIDEESAQVLRRMIVEIVSIKQGCKAMELIPELMSRLHTAGVTVRFSTHGICNFIDAMIHTGAIRAVEYTLPAVDYRIKRFLIPGGSHVEVLHSK